MQSLFKAFGLFVPVHKNMISTYLALVEISGLLMRAQKHISVMVTLSSQSSRTKRIISLAVYVSLGLIHLLYLLSSKYVNIANNLSIVDSFSN